MGSRALAISPLVALVVCMLVKGMDRRDGSALRAMPDQLWQAHTAEVQSRFDEQKGRADALSFDEFCLQFQGMGGLTTEAMRGFFDAVTGFPKHWGEPPRIQTRDLVPLPGGYGQGSSTLSRWIKEKMGADDETVQSTCASIPDTKESWPELVGMAP